MNAALTLPFGAARKIVLVRELDKRGRKKAGDEDKVEGEDEDKGGLSAEEIAGLEKYLSRPNPSTILVLEGAKAPAARLAKLLDQSGEMIEANFLKEKEVRDWLIGRARENGRGLSPDAAQVIAERVGPDLALASQELEKVLLYTEAKTVPPETVRKILSGGSSVSDWDLYNAIGARDLAEAIKSLNRLFAAGNSPFMIVGQLAGKIRKLLRIRLLIDRGRTEPEIGKILKIYSSYALQCQCREGRAYSSAEIRRALRELAQLDLKLKRTGLSPRLLLEMFLVGFVSRKDARNPAPPKRN